MRIQDLFQRDIARPINGVVKADQLDASSIWQELDEFVVTKELDKHLRQFFSAYTNALDHPNDPDVAGKIGVWVSGFFGSGKSHFIKVLSYLLENKTHEHDGQAKAAVDFFQDKIHDPMLLGDIKRAVSSQPDVILFNIDSKADHREGRDAMLQVFLKVFNEKLGYSPDHPHIAHMERYLDRRGKLKKFHEHFRELTDTEWIEERDAYEFNRDEVVQALSKTLGQSESAVEKWIDGAEETFSVTIENFAKWVKEYLDSQDEDHRILFFADEVGQFIGGDTHLMLNLQTLSEQLGTTCGGRAWVVVTSQEDIDAVLGEMERPQRNDFSKIQGRFKTRLSLTGANVDEVLQKRLLSKREEAAEELRGVFDEEGDIMRNHLTFRDTGQTFRNYRDAEEFVKDYPFVPYQFQLLQKIFEAIRTVGATGLHLARGERSMLDAFQSAAKQLSDEEVGVLVPLWRFYPSIESFLEGAVKSTIDNAAEQPGIGEFDIKLLQILFLIRYVDEMKGNVDNLVTLCLEQIDQDHVTLRRQIEEGLQRLENETLISRNGDTYFFLTNEERDISREIKQVDLSSGEEARLLGTLIFEDLLKGRRKFRYPHNGMDFDFNRICDLYPVGNQADGALKVAVISPLADDYKLYDKSKCVMESGHDDGYVLIRLGDDERIGREIRTYLQTEKYVKRTFDATLPESTKRILRDLQEVNHGRRSRLTELLKQMLVEADYYAASQPLKITGSSPDTALDQALEYLVENTFSKMGYLQSLADHPEQQIQTILRSNDIEQQSLALNLPESNPQAIEDVRSYVELCHDANRQIVLFDMLNGRFAKRPYGWPTMQTALIIARLLVLGEIGLVMDGELVPASKAYEPLTTPNKQRKVRVVKRRIPDPKAIQNARTLGKDVFGQMGPDGEEALFTFLQERLGQWRGRLAHYKTLADTGRYPGGQEIGEGLQVIDRLVAEKDSFKFIERFNGHANDLKDLADDFHDIDHFYEHQRPTWDKLHEAAERFALNRLELEQDEQAAPALRRIQEILAAAQPYALIKEAEKLISTVDSVNQKLIGQRQAEALGQIDQKLEQLRKDVETAGGDDSLRSACLPPLEQLRSNVESQKSLAHITQAEQEAIRLYDAAEARIQEFADKARAADGDGGTETVTVKKRRVIRPAELAGTTYLESPEDVEAFVEKLRKALEEAVAQNERIEIR